MFPSVGENRSRVRAGGGSGELLRGFAIGPLVAASVVGLGQSASQAATARPTRTFSDSSTQPTLGSAYTTTLQSLLHENGPNDGLRLVQHNGTADGTPVEIWDCNGGSNQKWSR